MDDGSTARRKLKPASRAAQVEAEELRRQTEEHFDELVATVTDYAIFMLTGDGRVVTWNAGAERIKGYRADEILGEHFSRFYPAESIRRGWPDYELTQARSRGRFEDEGWRIRRDGSRFWANVVITALFSDRGELRGFLKVTRDLTERKMAEETLLQAHADLEDRVRRRTAELADANATLTAEVAERKRLEQELRQTVDRLREVDRNKNEFLAVLAHELRNPLAPLRNAIELLHLQRSPDPQFQRASDIMDRQLRQMARLVDDLVDLSRITRNTLRLKKAPTDLARIVADAVETSRPFIEAHEHQLTVAIPPPPIELVVDATRLAQVFSNLLINAAKFTPRGGHISLTVERGVDCVIARVRDDGIGIPSEQLQAVFDMFLQVERVPERPQGGLGVGLSLAKRLVELHGGTIEVASSGAGHGSEFTVRLPLAGQLPVERPDVTRIAGAVDEPLLRRILVVDDNRDAADSLNMILSMMGCDVRTGYDGLQAVRIAEEFRPEVVLLDIGMPRMDGYEVARRIRRHDWGRQTLLIAMTGWGQDEDKQRTKKAGFDHHLVKPADPDVLRRILTGDSVPPR